MQGSLQAEGVFIHEYGNQVNNTFYALNADRECEEKCEKALEFGIERIEKSNQNALVQI